MIYVDVLNQPMYDYARGDYAMEVIKKDKNFIVVVKKERGVWHFGYELLMQGSFLMQNSRPFHQANDNGTMLQ